VIFNSVTGLLFKKLGPPEAGEERSPSTPFVPIALTDKDILPVPPGKEPMEACPENPGR